MEFSACVNVERYGWQREADIINDSNKHALHRNSERAFGRASGAHFTRKSFRSATSLSTGASRGGL